jgi:hypothetical protein
MESTGCPETSVRNYCYALRKCKKSAAHIYTAAEAVNRATTLSFSKVEEHCILLSITSKMQRYAVFFITVNALHVSGGFSANHQELKTVHTA